MTTETIEYTQSESALFGYGDETREGVDVAASIDRYTDLLLDALTSAYPDARVTVDTSDMDGGGKLRINGWSEADTNGDLRDEFTVVQQIASDLWTDGAWVVNAGAGAA